MQGIFADVNALVVNCRCELVLDVIINVSQSTARALSM
jgi:hypothetical protein